jgi:Ser/Thr protein kinase RdoA (MazF antagonist)
VSASTLRARRPASCTLVPAVARLLAARRPAGAPSQLIHGDLTRNVLFADEQPPADIDFSPYWRPKAFASAIVAVDAVV